jgi:hypothetical protein
MEHITRAHILSYGKELASSVADGMMSASTAQNYVSAVNRVMEICWGDRRLTVSPTVDCGIPKRSRIAKENKAMPTPRHEILIRDERIPETQRVLLGLQRALGLRFEESAKLDAKAALRQAIKNGCVRISAGTKGGRSRIVPVTPENIDVLRWAASLQTGWSMIPPDMSYKKFRQQSYAIARRHGFRYHSERHAYAQSRYEDLAACLAPVPAGVQGGAEHHAYIAEALGIPVEDAKKRDQEVRTTIAGELGHGRLEITRGYFG